MANTTNIHIRKSTTTAIPPTGNLEIGELAYSYVSNTMFIGGSDELGILPIGGYSQVVKLNAAFDAANVSSYAYDAANAVYTFSANTVELIANSAYAKANAAYTFAANDAMLAANSAYAAQNTTYTYSANVVMSASNAAFAMANAANLMPVGNTIANGYWTIRSTRRRINFIPGASHITINVDDDPTLNTANVTINSTEFGAAYALANATWTYAANNVMLAANSAYAAQNSTYTFSANTVRLIANSAYAGQNATYTYAANVVMSASNAAFAMANAANLMPVGNTMANGYYTNRATRRNLNFIPGSLITINVNDDPTLNTSNITIDATAADPQYAFAKANLAYTYAANDAMLAANSAYAKANAANITADSTYTYAANNVMSAANAAFAMANAANLMPVGNTMANGYWTVRSTKRQINFIPGSLITINVNNDATLNTANVIIDATAADPQYAFAKANLAYTYAANDAMSAANSAYAAQNTTYTYAANNVMLAANNAYAAQNTTYGYAANQVMSAANAAFAMANAANLMPIGNTIFSNNYHTVRATRRKINFIPGAGHVTINVNDDATINAANVIISTTEFGASYALANDTWTYAANNVMLAANSAYAAQNSTYTFAANTVRLIANSAYAAQNSTYTYAANNVMLVANAAFAMANAANLMPVGNTMANGYWTTRSTRRRINFIPGSNITINVDDDPTLNTANITITSTASGGDPTDAFIKANLAYTYAANNAMLAANSAYAAGNTTWTYAANNVMLAANSAYAAQNSTYTYAANQVMSAANAAFAMANAANLMPVGNTMSNSYFTVRATRRRINFIEGSNITIKVDDDPTLNTSNITITASVTGGDPSDAFNQANTASNTAIAAFNAANTGNNFLGLNDTPGSYSGFGNYLVAVSSGETQLGFVNEIQIDELVHTARLAPANVSNDSVTVYVTASGVSPNREVAYKVKNELGEEIIISSILV